MTDIGSQGDITRLLVQWREGEAAAFDELMPLVYPHLREVAAAYMRRERNPDGMQATVLVHELYLRLLQRNRTEIADRRHFYTFSAKVMRLILIDHARETKAQSRGGGLQRVPLSDDLSWIEIGSADILELNIALDELEQMDARKARLVELRYFLGCTAEETADLLELSKATIDRELRFVRSWLFKRIHPDAVSAPAGL